MSGLPGPVIGIAGATYVVQRFWGELPVHGVPTSYVDAVAAAGGRPVILPPGHGVSVLDVVDGVVLAGGVDIGDDPERDAAEIALVGECRSSGIPLLGVCRGLQLLAVADGGELVTDLGAHLPHVLPGVGHPVTFTDGTGANVSSLHHQGVASLGPGWRAMAWADDGLIEAAQWVASDWPAQGVQWHPELDTTGPALFGWLVEASCRSRTSV